jgi:hypothetical protein
MSRRADAIRVVYGLAPGSAPDEQVGSGSEDSGVGGVGVTLRGLGFGEPR